MFTPHLDENALLRAFVQAWEGTWIVDVICGDRQKGRSRSYWVHLQTGSLFLFYVYIKTIVQPPVQPTGRHLKMSSSHLLLEVIHRTSIHCTEVSFQPHIHSRAFWDWIRWWISCSETVDDYVISLTDHSRVLKTCQFRKTSNFAHDFLRHSKTGKILGNNMDKYMKIYENSYCLFLMCWDPILSCRWW